MNIIFLLAPFSVLLGLIAVGAFLWTLRSGQYEDIEGSAARILIEDADAEDALVSSLALNSRKSEKRPADLNEGLPERRPPPVVVRPLA